MHFQNIHTFTYQKTLLHTLLLLVFKIVESLQCILKNQLFQTSEIDPTRLKSQNDNINTSRILERLSAELQDQVSALKNHLERKDKVINTLLEKLEKTDHEEFLLS